ncbi:hypothetical protein AB0I16_17035 [Streptomyces sp. NPDC050703]|uniref:hypothetical protein n=1 Tax=Streptomyces sp. NPDC050703 TaxID=3157218 RepID=UPI0034216CFE
MRHVKQAALLVSATALTTALAATPAVSDMHWTGTAKATASSGTSEAADKIADKAAGEFGAMSWIYVGTYRTLSACQADGRNSIYSEWDCKKNPSSGKWQLWVNDES